MTTFLDGPASGVQLRLTRAPHFLRAVRDGNKWDALDQLDDTPHPHEDVFAYEMVSGPTWYHIRATKGRSGCFRGGEYRLVADQPDSATLRTNRAWRDWCAAHAPADTVAPETRTTEER